MKTTFLLILLIPAFVLTLAANQTYTVTIHADEYSITETKDGNHEIHMENFGKIGIPGKPFLPSKTFMVALPPGADVTSFHFFGSPQEIEGNFKIIPAPIKVPKGRYSEYIEEAKKEYNENYNSTYSSDIQYPSEIAKFEGMGNLRKWRFAYVKFSPFQYRPKSARLEFEKDITITLHFTLPSENSEEWKTIQKELLDNKADEQAKTLFVNYKDAKRWYTTPKIDPDRGCIFGQKGRSQIYVIIVPDVSYFSAVVDYAIWKETTLNDSVWIISADTIEAYFPDSTKIESIRNFLNYTRLNFGTQYALLVGNILDIPMLYCWPDSNIHTPVPNKFPVPTDYYYAELTSNWDSDLDGFPGEFGQDIIDFAAEIVVGRIPWSNPTIVQQICDKLKIFEQNTGSWKKNSLMLGSISFTSNYPPVTDEAQVMRDIQDSLLIPLGWSYWRMYEKSGLDTSLLPCDDSLCQTNVRDKWSTNHYGYVNWSGHGGYDGAYRTINVGGHDSMPPIFLSSDTLYLNDNYPSIVFSSACLTAKPEEFNLGDNLIKHGSSGFIGGTRFVYGCHWDSLYWNIGGNTSYNCYFALEMMRNLKKVGNALYDSKITYHNDNYSDWMDQTNLFAFILYGDPAMIWQGYTGIKEESENVLVFHPFLFLSPNPARNRVKIQYNISSNSKVTIRIFDIAGRVIRTIIDNASRNAGSYTTNWDGKTNRGRKASAGVYFCKLKSKNVSLTRKFTLIR